MKRELAFALEAQSQLTGSFGRTRSSKAHNSALNGVSKDRSSRRVKGFAVFESGSNGSINGSQKKPERNGLIYENQEKEVSTSQSNGIAVYRRNKRFKSATVELEVNESVVKTVSSDEIECNLVTEVCEVENVVNLAHASVMEEPIGGVENPALKEGDCEVSQAVVDESKKMKKNVPVKAPRRFTRSALKPNVEPVECLVSSLNVLDNGRSEAVLEVEGNETGVEVNESLVKTVSKDEIECNLATPVLEVENVVNLAQAPVMEESMGGIENPALKGGDCEVAQVVVDESRKMKKNVPVKAPRRFTRSALKPKVEPVECLESGAIGTGVLDGGNREAVLEVEGNEIGAVSALGTPTKKLELKMSKKITLTKQPTNIKELFGTGLLEGCSVFYNGGNKGNALTGVVKGTGILCSCNLCKGYRVVTPSQFEMHACQSYRHAAQYICLENGKNLLQVVNACKRSPLDTLEETIQSTIGSLPVREPIICQHCKGSFNAMVASKFGQVCESCLELKDLQASPFQTAGPSTRSSKSASVLKRSSRTAKVGILSENNSQEKIPKKSSKPASVSKSSESALVSCSPQNKIKGKREKKSSKSAWALKSSGSASERISSQKKSRGKITKNSLKPTLVSKSSRSASVHITSANRSRGKIRKKSSKSVVSPRSSKSASLSISQQKKSRWKITKKDLRLHKLVFEEDGLPDGTELAYYSNGQKLLQGYKKGLGIFCSCCRSEVSASTFEAHAGWASRRKPYGYIYTSNGVSLHELAISLLKGREYAARDNDDLCIICADGGNLLLCDGCPRAFHRECASLTSIPRGKWFCQYCQNMFQREKFVEHNANAVAAGRISGVDPIEQITKRCIRIIKNPEEVEVIACVLCRGYDFSKSGFGALTVILCDQCEKEYHVGCLKKYKMAELEELPNGKWFCSMDCHRIYSALQDLLIRGEEKLPDSLLDVLKKKHEDKDSGTVFDFDVRWRILSGKIASRETRLLLSKAVAIFHECFDPIVDLTTGQDFIPSMVYGRNIRGQDYGGMYCAVLTVNSSVVSAAILRVFGCEVAELPLVATSNGNQGKGYFQILFSCIERLLAFLNVRTFVLPAAEEAESIWTNKFEFEKIPLEQLDKYKKDFLQMMTFKGTAMLQKRVPQCRMILQDV